MVNINHGATCLELQIHRKVGSRCRLSIKNCGIKIYPAGLACIESIPWKGDGGVQRTQGRERGEDPFRWRQLGGAGGGGVSLNCKVRPLGDCTLRKNISLGVTGEWTRVNGKK